MEKQERTRVTKSKMLKELVNIIDDYNNGDERVRAMDKINAIKTICDIKGYKELVAQEKVVLPDVITLNIK